MKFGRLLIVLAVLLPTLSNAATEIKVWHALYGIDAQVFNDLIDRFNAQQSEVHVTGEFRGDAELTAQAGLAAVRGLNGINSAKEGPHLLQVRDDLSNLFLQPKPLARPLAQVLSLEKSADFNFFVPNRLSHDVSNNTAQITKPKHTLSNSAPFNPQIIYGFPLQRSAPLFYYNQDAYLQAGLDPNTPPKTWSELQAQLLRLQSTPNGLRCGYTTSNQAWIYIESLAAWHGEPIAAPNQKGLNGETLTFNGLLHVRHVALMMSWLKSGLFTYAGRNQEGDEKFASGECATLTSSSAALGKILKNAKFNFGVAPLPYYPEGMQQSVTTLINGSSLWVMQGKSPEEYSAVAKFLAFFASPAIARLWYQQTNNLPLTNAAYRLSQEQGFHQQISGWSVALQKIVASSNRAACRYCLLPSSQVRNIVDGQLEEVWSAKKAPKQGLDDAVAASNKVLLNLH